MSAQPVSADLRTRTSSTRPSDQTLARSNQTAIHYVGLITRAIAFALDGAVINVVAIVVEVGAALILSLVHISKDLKPVLVTVGAVAYALWALGYFVGFWAGTGQTPGNRVMQIRVVAAHGEPIKPRRAVVRCIGLLLAALPLFAGYVPILFDRRRRGLQDYMARTVVVEAPKLTIADVRSEQIRAAGEPQTPASDAHQAQPQALARSSDSGDDRAFTRMQP